MPKPSGDREVRYFPIHELRVETEGDEPRLRGYAAVFNRDSLDLGGFVERVAPGAFRDSVQRADKGEGQIHAFWNHDPGIPLGSVRGGKLALSEDKRGLAFDLSAKRLTAAQLDAVADGDMQMSFGFRTREDTWDHEAKPPLRTLNDVELFEVSLVAMPAYPDTAVALRSLEEAKKEAEPPAPSGPPVALLKREIALRENAPKA